MSSKSSAHTPDPQSVGSQPEPSKADLPVHHCACSPQEVGRGGKAVGVDPEAKARNLKRLRRIEGQVRGLQKMVDEDRYCADILIQLSSVQEALRAVGRELLRNHLKYCASAAIRAGAPEADAMYEELLDLMYRNAR